MVQLRARPSGASSISPSASFSDLNSRNNDIEYKSRRESWTTPSKRHLRNNHPPLIAQSGIHLSDSDPARLVISGLQPHHFEIARKQVPDVANDQEYANQSDGLDDSPRARRQAKRAAARSPSPLRTSPISHNHATHGSKRKGSQASESPSSKRRKLSSSTSKLGSEQGSVSDARTSTANRTQHNESEESAAALQGEAAQSIENKSCRENKLANRSIDVGNATPVDSRGETPNHEAAPDAAGSLKTRPTNSSITPLREVKSFKRPTPKKNLTPVRATTTTVSKPATSRHQSRDPSPPSNPNVLEAKDLPGPFRSRPPSPDNFKDEAAKIGHRRYKPLQDPNVFVKSLLKHDPSARSIDTLRRLAENTYHALLAWQDEYLKIDQRTAPMGHNPPKKPATGGRIPIDPTEWSHRKEVDMYGHVLGVEGIVLEKSTTNRATASAGTILPDGKRLRRRGADTSLIDKAAVDASDVDAPTRKRARKPPRRFDAGSNGNTDGRKRRRGQGDAGAGSNTDETASQQQPRKRGRTGNLRTSEARSLSQQNPPQQLRRPVSPMPGTSAMQPNQPKSHDNAADAPPTTYIHDFASSTNHDSSGATGQRPLLWPSSPSFISGYPPHSNEVLNDPSRRVPRGGTTARSTRARNGRDRAAARGWRTTPAPVAAPAPATIAPNPLPSDPQYHNSMPSQEADQRRVPPPPPAAAQIINATPASFSMQQQQHMHPFTSVNAHPRVSSESLHPRGPKSAKRSKSMTKWWAERKRMQAEEKERKNAGASGAPAKTPDHNATATGTARGGKPENSGRGAHAILDFGRGGAPATRAEWPGVVGAGAHNSGGFPPATSAGADMDAPVAASARDDKATPKLSEAQINMVVASHYVLSRPRGFWQPPSQPQQHPPTPPPSQAQARAQQDRSPGNQDEARKKMSLEFVQSGEMVRSA